MACEEPGAASMSGDVTMRDCQTIEADESIFVLREPLINGPKMAHWCH